MREKESERKEKVGQVVKLGLVYTGSLFLSISRVISISFGSRAQNDLRWEKKTLAQEAERQSEIENHPRSPASKREGPIGYNKCWGWRGRRSFLVRRRG